jgi:hypothetical protein
MSNIKKVLLDTKTQETLWNLIHNEHEVIAEVFGTEVKLTVLPVIHDQEEIIKEIESDPDLQIMLLESEQDEEAGLLYSSDEAIQLIREYHSK